MKVLMVFPYAPLPPPYDLGGTKRNLPFLRENLKRNEVTVLSYGTIEEEGLFRKTFGSLCSEVRFVNRKRPRIVNAIEQIWLIASGQGPFRQIYRQSMQQALDSIVGRTNFDIIHCCTQLLGYFRFPEHVPVIADAHEVTYDLIHRTFKTTKNLIRKLWSYFSYRFGKSEELKLCKKFDAVIAITHRDFGIFRAELPDQRIIVIENGVDPAFFQPHEISPEHGSIIFTGKMNFFPNVHGILWFIDEIFPLILSRVPDAKVYVVGAYPPRSVQKRRSNNIIVTGFVDDVRPYMARGEVFIIPIWIAGGIRGKALEAMAMKKAIVTTSIGCESLDLSHEDSALFADSPEDFASAVVRLLNDPALRVRLEENGYRHVANRFNWGSQGEKLYRVYQSVVQPQSALPESENPDSVMAKKQDS